MQGTLRLMIAGDMAPIRHFAPLAENEPLSLYGDLLPVLQEADYRIVNLESPLAGSQFIIKSGAEFTGQPCHLPLLTSVPFDAVTMANNHTFDTGREGFIKTCELLDGAKIARLGAGDGVKEALKPLYIHKNGVNVAVFNISEGEDECSVGAYSPGVVGWKHLPAMLKLIKVAKARRVYQAIIVVVHCGLEYYPFPAPYVREFFAKLAESGVDLVVGHHVHVPQGATMLGNTRCYFSLGNFVFYQANNLLHRKTGYMLDVTVDRNGIHSCEPVPYRIGENGVRLLDVQEEEAFQMLFKELSAPLRSEEETRKAWEACISWYGVEGYVKELRNIADKLESNPQKGAAMLRNRLFCPQHMAHWQSGIKAIIDGRIKQPDTKYYALVDRFFKEECQ